MELVDPKKRELTNPQKRELLTVFRDVILNGTATVEDAGQIRRVLARIVAREFETQTVPAGTDAVDTGGAGEYGNAVDTGDYGEQE